MTVSGEVSSDEVREPRRSGWIMVSAVILFVVAVISGLMGLVLVLLALTAGPWLAELMGAGAPGPFGDAMAGFVTGVMVVFGLVALVWAGGHTAAGIGILAGRGWARITGMVLAILGLVFGMLSLSGTLLSIGQTEAMMRDPAFADLYAGMTPDEVVAESIIFGLAFILPFVIGYVVVLVTLARTGAFFAGRSRAQAG